MRGEVEMALEINRESVEFLAGRSQLPQLYVDSAVLHSARLQRPKSRFLPGRKCDARYAEAIDRDEIVKQGMRGRGHRCADDPIWPFHWASNPATQSPRYHNPERARVRLDARAFRCVRLTPGQRASRFQLKCMFYNVDPQFERIGLLLQRQLAAVGIDLDPRRWNREGDW